MIFTPEKLQLAAAALSVAGSILLAWRVSQILKALSLVASVHEVNIDQLMSSTPNIVHFGNSTKHVERAKDTGLLVVGFLLLTASYCIRWIKFDSSIHVSMIACKAP
jgi:hypothetical protein